MSTLQAPAEHYRDAIARLEPQLVGGDLPWLKGYRQSAARTFAELDFPQRRQEAWRYTNVAKLLAQPFQPVTDPFAALQQLDVHEFRLPATDAYRLVIANGRLVPALSDLTGLSRDITVGGLHQTIERHPELLEPWLGLAVNEADSRFAAMNSALVNDGLFIHIPRSQQPDRPIEVLYLTMGLDDAIVVQPRNLIVLEHGARATVIERYMSPGRSLYFNNGLSEIFLDDGARLDHIRMQQESPTAYHLHGIFVKQRSGSRYTHTGFALGGAWARTGIDVDFVGEGAEARLDGLYTAGDNQLTDIHLHIQHTLPGCKSQSNFKGILHGKGRAVFDGRVVVKPQAQKTDAHLNNANLLLTRNAEVDTKPQLEIYADDVQCSHGTTVGQLEEAQLFYLRSRGIDTVQAQRLLCLGFAGEILSQCEIPALRQAVETVLQDKLSGTGAYEDGREAA